MIRLSQIKMKPGHTFEELVSKTASELKLSKKDISGIEIVRQSIDARKKPQIFLIYTIDVKCKREKEIVRRCKNAVLTEKAVYHMPIRMEASNGKQRPIVIGAGPAGLFCAWMLAKAGLAPIVLERGKDVEARTKDVERFWKTGILEDNSNVQFGEGGAGTFSDGKLNTQIKDPTGRIPMVLSLFVKHGADPEILYQQKPHVGTDVLKNVVTGIRKEIIENGGEVRFETQVTDFMIRDERITGIQINHSEWIEADTVVLAIGHSARDTFAKIRAKNIQMTGKAFAVGFRISHPQAMINKAMYGAEKVEHLSAAPYKLTRKTDAGRGLYSFCMCPGGYVVNASSEKEMTAVNGMSYHDRGSKNANSAIVLTVSPEDFDSVSDPLSGIRFQEKLEANAYRAGGGKIPVQLLGDFEKKTESKSFGDVEPVFCGEYELGSLNGIFTENLEAIFRNEIREFERIIPGFSRKDALLAGVESRTSSPVRIERNELFEASVAGIYPCGEGAGYAGGITSAAVDGVKVAEKILNKNGVYFPDNL